MMIPTTKQAIKFYELAIVNAQNALDFYINQDEAYQKFVDKNYELGYSTLFHGHTYEFVFYKYESARKKEDYFRIKDGKIVYGKDFTFENIEEVAEELLEIVKKFY